MFRRLAVFVGGFTLEAAEAVCWGFGTLDGVAALADMSLLRAEDGEGDERRFAMLETVREYGLEQLAASGEELVVRARHCQALPRPCRAGAVRVDHSRLRHLA